MAQIRQVVSENLQATIRRLLPSQQGFTEDLQASNVIQPIIDLTPTAEGSVLPDYLQRASSYDDVNAFNAANSTVTVANTAGFWLVKYSVAVFADSTAGGIARFSMSDGISTKTVLAWDFVNASANPSGMSNGELVVFLEAGHSLSATSTSGLAELYGHAIAIADTNGNLSNPAGYNPA